MKYGYDIIDEKGIVWGDSGDMLFDTQEQAIKDANSFIPDMIETEKKDGHIINGNVHVELWETTFTGMEVC